jgi:hypothetical protein
MLPVLPYVFAGSAPRLSSEVNNNFQYIVNFLNQGASGTVDGGVQHDNFALNASALNFAVSGVNALTCTFSANRNTVPVVNILSTVNINDAPFYVSAAGSGTIFDLIPSSQAVGLEAKTSGTGAALEIAVDTAAIGIQRQLAAPVVPLTVTGTNAGAFYGAFATLPSGTQGAVTYDTTSNKLKWYDAQAAQWKNAQSGWIEGEITETGGALAVTGTVTPTKLGPPNIYFGSGDIPDNSSTSFPASPTHSVTFTKAVAHTTLLCTLTGTGVFGGGRNTGATRTDYLDIGIFVNGTLTQSIPLMTRGVAGADSMVFLAFYAPIGSVAAGTVTVDMRIRKGNSNSGTAYLSGAVLQVVEL